MTKSIKIIVRPIAPTKKSKTSKRRINEGRDRKQELRNGTMSYKTRKKLNMMDLVQEYEMERNENMVPYYKARILNIIRLCDMAITKTVEQKVWEQIKLDDINVDMLVHYNNVSRKMIASYKEFLGFPKPDMLISFDKNNKQRQKNLQQMVQEYESERSIFAQQRQKILEALEVEGMIKYDDTRKEQDFAEYEINQEMINYYRNLEKQMIENYKNIDVIKHATLQADALYNEPAIHHKKGIRISIYDIGRDATPYQLRLVVNSFNNNQRNS